MNREDHDGTSVAAIFQRAALYPRCVRFALWSTIAVVDCPKPTHYPGRAHSNVGICVTFEPQKLGLYVHCTLQRRALIGLYAPKHRLYQKTYIWIKSRVCMAPLPRDSPKQSAATDHAAFAPIRRRRMFTETNAAEELPCSRRAKMAAGWGGRIRTSECRYQKPVPYHLATPQCVCSRPQTDLSR